MKTTTLNINKTQAQVFHFVYKETNQNLIRITTLLIDVIARVTTRKTLYIDAECSIVSGGNFCGERISSSSAHTTCTTYVNLTFVLRVKVYKIVTIHKTALHANSTRKTCFFVASKHALNRTMFDVVRLKNSHLHSYTNTIVCTQSCTLCTHPFTIYVGFNGIIIKVKVYILVLFAHHVHV